MRYERICYSFEQGAISIPSNMYQPVHMLEAPGNYRSWTNTTTIRYSLQKKNRYHFSVFKYWCLALSNIAPKSRPMSKSAKQDFVARWRLVSPAHFSHRFASFNWLATAMFRSFVVLARTSFPSQVPFGFTPWAKRQRAVMVRRFRKMSTQTMPAGKDKGAAPE